MFKKIALSAIAGTCLMAMAGAADAATYNINIYGASAQYTYWTTAAPAYLKSRGCADADIRSASKKVSGREQGIAWCAGTVGLNGVTGRGFNNNGNDYFIRYSANASYDGIMGVQNNATYMPAADSAAGCSAGERLMANENTVTWVAYPGSPTTGNIGGVSCKDITIGASDVAAKSFSQYSKGYLTGHREYPGGTEEVRDIKNITISTSSYNSARPLVVPFGFFANTSVPYDNMTRLMATSIFSGQVANWQDFNEANPDLQVVACLRHAGSGTHATLDKAVMRKDFPLVRNQITPAQSMGATTVVWFNSGTSEMMNCINENQGAVGYADADRNITSLANTKRMFWMGASAARANITGGVYDFWSKQWLYYSKSEPTDVRNLITSLVNFASNPANMPSSLSTYWAASNEMKVEKSSDEIYPSFQ